MTDETDDLNPEQAAYFALVERLKPLRDHLRLDFCGAENDLLLQKLNAAEAFVGNFIGKPLADFDPVPADITEAVLQLAGHWYENREATIVGMSADVMPFGVSALLAPHVEWVM